MKALRRAALSILVLAGMGQAEACAQDVRRAKKLIATGWDKADTRRLRENLAVMEERPFDGVVLEAVGRTGEGKPCRLRWAFLPARGSARGFSRASTT